MAPVEINPAELKHYTVWICDLKQATFVTLYTEGGSIPVGDGTGKETVLVCIIGCFHDMESIRVIFPGLYCGTILE